MTAKLLVNALAVAGTALIVGAAFPVLAATVVGSGVILVGSSLSVWALDKVTDFEKKSVEKILESLE
ncbi:hypothetical protein [Salinivibrio socompensis]|uniref:hypothetical protein n=1 Tax=Salinivibrio socompensis TaxID=1510206 RepID=UPI00046F8EDD|nr:hypothetical protein [Salinivibrio socompensis]